MAHIGFLTLDVMGHLFPMSTLARELQQRGHRVTFFCFADSLAFLQMAGLPAAVIAEQMFPLGFTRRVSDSLALLKGSKGVHYSVEYFRLQACGHFSALPDALRAAQIDVLVIDQFSMAGATVCEHLHVPYVHVAAALMANIGDSFPPISTPFGPEQNFLAVLRNRLARMLIRRVFRPLITSVNQQRTAWQLPVYTEFFNERLAGGPQICQEPQSFEFPRKTLPARFHFVGPLHRRESRNAVAFPWEQLDGRPIVYASMGTLQNGLDWVFRTIAEACDGLPAQLIISLGGNLDPADFAALPGNPIVVRFAPQLPLLERAQVCITHAGLNTALESLAQGVPMVAIPITNDQPGVAARIVWTGTGKSLSLKKLTAESLRSAVVEVLSKPAYRSNAKRLQQEIASVDSAARACEIVESVIP